MTNLHVMAGVSGLALAVVLFILPVAGLALLAAHENPKALLPSGHRDAIDEARTIMRIAVVLSFFAFAWLFGVCAYITLEWVW